MKNLKLFKNKKIIITGHTGFKGSWLAAWLKLLGADIMGISLKPSTRPSHFDVAEIKRGIKDVRLDIRNKKKIEKKILSFKPDFIFHLAAQALVGLSYKNSSLTLSTSRNILSSFLS